MTKVYPLLSKADKDQVREDAKEFTGYKPPEKQYRCPNCDYTKPSFEAVKRHCYQAHKEMISLPMLYQVNKMLDATINYGESPINITVKNLEKIRDKLLEEMKQINTSGYPYFPITTKEIQQSLIPINYEYFPGHPYRYRYKS